MVFFHYLNSMNKFSFIFLKVFLLTFSFEILCNSCQMTEGQKKCQEIIPKIVVDYRSIIENDFESYKKKSDQQLNILLDIIMSDGELYALLSGNYYRVHFPLDFDQTTSEFSFAKETYYGYTIIGNNTCVININKNVPSNIIKLLLRKLSFADDKALIDDYIRNNFYISDYDPYYCLYRLDLELGNATLVEKGYSIKSLKDY